MSQKPLLPADDAHLDTNDPQEVAEYLRQTYVKHRPRARKNAPESWYASRVRRCGNGFTTSVTSTTLGFGTDTDPFHDAVVRVVHSGRVRITAGGDEVRSAAGDVLMLRPHLACDIEWDRVQVAGVTIPYYALEEAAGERCAAPTASLRFEASTPITRDLAAYWARLSAFVLREMFTPATAMRNPLLAAQVQRLLADAALIVFPNTTMTGYPGREPGAAAPAAVRRAVHFIEQHAGEPISLAQIAAAARARPRSLQYAFRRHHNTTPVEYLRTVRLDRAHRDLQTADPARGDSVAAIAHRWGYTSTTGFASAYRRAYGTSPSHTLRS